MTMETAFSLISFALVMSISPGPGNFLLLASGANFGFVRTLPLLFGISFGFLFMVFLVGIGLGHILEQYPVIHKSLRLICVVYVLWLAIQIGRSRSMEDRENSTKSPIGFIKAALLQWVNPKAWTVALIVNISFALPGPLLSGLLQIILLFAIVNIPCIGVWALSGSAIRRLLCTRKRLAAFNMCMAAVLVLSVVPLLITT